MSQFALLFLLIVLLQVALIYYGHFSPFERENNLQAVIWGARPAPRYWAVLALDILTGLLIAIAALALWKSWSPGGDLPWSGLAFLAISAAFSLITHHFVNLAIIRFPNYSLVVRKLVPALAAGFASVMAAFLAAGSVMERSLGEIAAAAASLVQNPVGILLPAFAFAIAIFFLRSLAFFLRVLPVVGNILHAATSTLLLFWFYYKIGSLYARSAGLASPSLLDRVDFTGMEAVTLVIAGTSVFALLLAWRLPGPKHHPNAVEPPPLVIDTPSATMPEVRLGRGDATLIGERLRVEISAHPLGITVFDRHGLVIWQLEQSGLARDRLLQKVLSIPLLYTGNTIKFWKRLGGAALDQAVELRAENGALLVDLGEHLLRISFHSADILRLHILPAGDISGVKTRLQILPTSLSLAFTTPPDAHFLGFGQRFGRFDQRGQRLYFLVEEGGVGYAGLAPLLSKIFGQKGSFPNGEHCTGFPIPFGLISREEGPTTGVFWATYSPSWLELPAPHRNPQRKAARLTVLDAQMDFYLCAGPTADQAIEQYTRLTGRPNIPPPWVLLPWKTRTGPVVEEDVFEDIYKFRELEIPLAQIGIEHWQDVRGSYEFSPEWFPHIDELIATAEEYGYHIGIWHFPYMNAGCTTHLEGVRKGYFIRNRLGLPYQQRIFHGLAAVVDYTNPDASDWHQTLVAECFHRRGLTAVMTDYAESIPPESIFANGKEGLQMRNAYPVLYVRAMQRAAQSVLHDDHLIYPRAGYTGSQRFVTVQWPGDQDTDWDDGDGLPAAVRAMLNVSLAGFPVHGSDIGGWYDWFAPITTKELFLRWAEVGAYSPLMRAHGGPIGRNREPWKFDQETVEIYRELSEEHVRLFPYLHSLSCEAGNSGRPIIRHPSLTWPGIADLYNMEDAWMIGDALYIAPVIHPGQTSRVVLLPPGNWWSLSEDRPISNPHTDQAISITVEAPFGQVPRFLRQGYPLPRFIQVFDTFDASNYARTGSMDDEIEVWYYPGGESKIFRLFDGQVLDPMNKTNSLSSRRKVTWRTFASNLDASGEIRPPAST